MNRDPTLEQFKFLDEDGLETFCDSMFQKIEDEYLDQDEFFEAMERMVRRLPI